MGAATKLQGIIFDLDGTLGNTLPVCYSAFRHAFQVFLNRHYTDEEITSLFGPSEEGIIKRLVPLEWEACVKAYHDEYEKVHVICDKPFPGIEPTLNFCKQKNIALAIVTGKGEFSAAISLRYLGIKDYFDQIVAGSPNGGIKPFAIQSVLTKWNLSPQNVAYVGDSPYDMQAAKEVGVIPLAAAWAETANFESLEQMAPSAIFSTVESFIDWIETIQ
ncbi:HAD family hydrolase [Aetokthonos hydrillicola Thurmond2011]|jgi:phosphoglycolate phosphatase-like HAD superfamily hydrolase|uniref:HAD family hydrolase n=1 Tax=Aetokthonos hydrillicola Thurmond2011 TaxID=2712845 RepID=A0AAP5I5H6_9CYAN|nr:HAD family hydrolase [Aetokthonos hydrillicola]MBO3460015.1 HAD family hydrolase [Aetokthonos hydrillicola CCALA 1050]MBW4584612.1 HAD family hydrolase [Aetokthonos hydrillicola CCALA 1050]MDR9895156.1 HAD family hydrolase [Aetokthonos hydrillicola Thurmond2011]